MTKHFKYVACGLGLVIALAISGRVAWSQEHEAPAPGAGAHDEEHATGAPLGFKADLALWSAVTFLLFIVVLRAFAWGPMVTGLDNRESRLRQNLADAEAAREKAIRMLAEHQQKLDKVQEEVREILNEARRDADQTRQSLMADAQKEAEVVKDRAIREIQRSKDQALKELFDTMNAAVADATEHVLGRGLTSDDHRRLIDDAVSQFKPSQLN